MKNFFALILTLLSVSAAAAQSAPPMRGGFRVIVNPANPVISVDRKFVAEVFLRRATRWPNDNVIRPVDLDPGSRVRSEFSEMVMIRPVSAIRSYWQQNIFSGRLQPPPELRGDRAIVAYVAQFEDAIGYVSTETSLEGVKALELRYEKR